MAHEIDSITSFGEMLKYLRQRARMTQRELGTAVGYSYSHIARLERSQRLPDASVVRVHFVEALGLQPEVAARLIELADAVHRPMQLQAPQNRVLPMRMTSLVGRIGEWAKLRACWEAAALSRPQCVVISGEAGVGKTRLAEALIDWVEQQGTVTATTRCYAVEGAPAYSPVSAWLRTDSLRTSIYTLDPLWRTEVARILPELLTEQPNLDRPSLLTEGWQRQRFLEALVRVVLHGVPIVLFLDDLQWADHESIEWLNLLLHFDGYAQLMLVFTVRSEDAADNPGMVSFLLSLRQAGELTEVNLGPLSAEETATLAAQVTGQALTTRQADQLFRETEGNPLFAVEMLRAGDWNGEAGDEGTDGAPSGNLQSLLTLPTVQAVISWRLRQLSPQARELAGLAATVGHEFTLELLAKASGQTQADLLDSLEELIRRGLVNEHDAEQRESSYDFSHDKIREAAYMALSVMRRKLLHFRVAEALEGVDAGQLDTTSGQVAAHFDKANLLARALPYYVRAAEASRRIYANVEAIQCYSRSEELLSHLPTSAVMQSGLTLLAIREALGDLLSLNAQYTSARAAYERALADSVGLGDEVMRARLHRKVANTFQSQGKYDEASRAYKAAESSLGTQQKLREPVWLEEWMLIQTSRISLAYVQVHTDEMDELIQLIRPIIECHGTPEQRGQLFGLLFLTSAQRERYRVSEETISYVLAFFAAAQEKGDPLDLPNAAFNVGFAYLWNGNLVNAETNLHQALALSEHTGNLYTQVQSLSYLSCVYRMRGDINSTEQAVIRCIQLAEKTNQLDYIAQCQGHAAWLALQRGDLGEAEEKARLALTGKGASAYVMRWMALFPLMIVEMRLDDLGKVVDRAKDLLEPVRVRLPDLLNDALQHALRLWDQGDPVSTRSMLEHALALAKEFHYL